MRPRLGSASTSRTEEQDGFDSGVAQDIPIRLIRHSRVQVRQVFGELEELAASIAERGMLEPIIVRPSEGYFEVVAGNRRLEACKILWKTRISCIVMELDEREALEVALTENIQRKTLNPIEEAEAFKRYVAEFGYGAQADLARKIGKSGQYVSQRIRILSLPPDILDKVSRRLVTLSHAAELIGLSNEDQRQISDQVESQNISTREVRKQALQIRMLGNSESQPLYFGSSYQGDERRQRILRRCVASLRTTLVIFDDILSHLGKEEWFVAESLLASRKSIHEQIDGLIHFEKRVTRLELLRTRNAS